MDNNINPMEPVVPSPDAQMPDIPSVDDITVAEMPELEAVPETVAEAVEAAPEIVEDAAEAVEPAVEAAPEAVEQPAQEVPVVQEYPEGSGSPQYTSYVPQSSETSAAPEVYTAPVTPAPVIATPSYGAEQQPARPVPVYVSSTAGEAAGHGKAVASLILGIFALLFSWCCCGGLIPGIIGICLGAGAKSSGNKEGISTAGIVISIIAVILSIVIGISCAAITSATGETMQNMPEFQQFYDEMYNEMYGVIRMLF